MKKVQYEYWMRIKQLKLIIEECHEVLGSLENLTDRKFEDLKEDTFKRIQDNTIRLSSILKVGSTL